MGKTKIEWVKNKTGEKGYVWNPIAGCSKVSAGCMECYAERMAARLQAMCVSGNKCPEYLGKTEDGHWTGKIECCDWKLEIPLHWKKPSMIFVNSMSDTFHPNVPFEFIDKVMAVIALCPQHCFQLLSKRPEIMKKYFENCLPHISALVYNAKYGQRKDIFGSGRNRDIRDRRTGPDMAAQEGSRSRSSGGRRIFEGNEGQSVQASSGGILNQTRIFVDNNNDFKKKICNRSASCSVGLPQRANTEKIDDKPRGRNQRQQQAKQSNFDDLQSTTTSRTGSVEKKSLAANGKQASQNETERGRCFSNAGNENNRGDGQKHSDSIQNETESGVGDLYSSDLETHINWPLSNLWLGVTAENQEMADKRIPILLQIPAVVRFVSIEPCLEEILISAHYLPQLKYLLSGGKPIYGNNVVVYEDGKFKQGIDWVIVGCESGQNRRECKIEWVRSIVEQCKAANVPVFVKQLSINGKVSRDMAEWPEDLRVREYPK